MMQLSAHSITQIVIKERLWEGNYWYEFEILDDQGERHVLITHPAKGSDKKPVAIEWSFMEDNGDTWPFHPSDAVRHWDEDHGQPDDLTEHQDFAQDEDPPEHL